MRFTDLPKSFKDEREEFITRICKLTLASRSTVNRWLNGQITPSKARRDIIAKELGIPEEELFPQTTEK